MNGGGAHVRERGGGMIARVLTDMDGRHEASGGIGQIKQESSTSYTVGLPPEERTDLHHGAAWKTAFDRFIRRAPVSPLNRPRTMLIRPKGLSMQRQYPRTIAEFERRQMVTTRLRGR
jgi:hypothetical protein